MSYARKLRNNLLKPFPLHWQLFAKHITGGVEGNKLTEKDFTPKQLGFLKDAMLIKSRENTKFADVAPELQQMMIKNQNESAHPLPPIGYNHPVGGKSVSMYPYPHSIEKSFGHVQGHISDKGKLLRIKDQYKFDLLPGETKHAGSFDTSEGRGLGAGNILDWAGALGLVKPFDIDIDAQSQEFRTAPRQRMTPELQIKKQKRDKEISRIKDPLSIQAHSEKRKEHSMADWENSEIK